MGGQRTFASMAWNAKGKVTRREQFLAGDGCGYTLGASASADRAALSEGGQWPPAGGIGEDAADLLPAAVVHIWTAPACAKLLLESGEQ